MTLIGQVNIQVQQSDQSVSPPVKAMTSSRPQVTSLRQTMNRRTSYYKASAPLPSAKTMAGATSADKKDQKQAQIPSSNTMQTQEPHQRQQVVTSQENKDEHGNNNPIM